MLVYHLINKKIRKKGKIRGAYLKVGNEYWCNVQGDRKEVELTGMKFRGKLWASAPDLSSVKSQNAG